MFENIGGKIKVLARVITWLGIIASFYTGLSIVSSGSTIGEHANYDIFADMGLIVGIVVIVAGSVLSWVVSFVLYGFGQLVENSDHMRKILKKMSDENKFWQIAENSDSMKKTMSEMLNEYRIAQYKNDAVRAANNGQVDNAPVTNDNNSEG